MGAAIIRVDESLKAAFSSGVICAGFVGYQRAGKGGRERVESGKDENVSHTEFNLGVQRGG